MWLNFLINNRYANTQKSSNISSWHKYYETNEQRQEDSLTMSNPGYLDTNLQCVAQNKLVSKTCKSKATALALRYGGGGGYPAKQ